MKKSIVLSGITVQYDLQRKNVKNINIRIKKDLSIHVSAPTCVTQKRIEEILLNKSDFILSALNKYEKQIKNKKTNSNIGEQEPCVTVFGKALTVFIIGGKEDKASIQENGIYVTLKDSTDKEALKKTIDRALELLCIETVSDLCKEIYPEFREHLPDYPKIKFRKMKSRWGSCNYKKYILTFNYHLIHAPLNCIKYVVYHEFNHFIHPNHSKDYYISLSNYLPDHKVLKAELQKTTIPE